VVAQMGIKKFQFKHKMPPSYYDYDKWIHVFENGYIGYKCFVKNKFKVVKQTDEPVKPCGHYFHIKCMPGQTKCPVCCELLN
jgi:hypothetical protein